jgi:hypothetical protein
MRSDTSFTGRTQPAAVGSSTVSPRTSSKRFLQGNNDSHESPM